MRVTTEDVGKKLFNWIKWGTRGSYSIWYYGTAGYSTVWNVGKENNPPETWAGYNRLEGLLQVRGWRRVDCQQVGTCERS